MKKGTMLFNMIPCIKNVSEDFPEEITVRCPSPATDHLFKIKDKDTTIYFPQEQNTTFPQYSNPTFIHGVLGMYIVIHTAVKFITMKVKHPDEDK